MAVFRRLSNLCRATWSAVNLLHPQLIEAAGPQVKPRYEADEQIVCQEGNFFAAMQLLAHAEEKVCMKLRFNQCHGLQNVQDKSQNVPVAC